MASEYTFVVDKMCPVCEQSTRVVKIRAKLPIDRTDEDFCNHYKFDFNPYFYHIWVCEHCGFAGDEKNFLSYIPAKHMARLRKKLLSDTKVNFEFTEERHMPEAVGSYRLASLCAEMRDDSLHHQAGIVLRIAWLYRFAEEHQKEKEYLQKAVDLYIRSEEHERYPQGNMTEYDVKYLISAIYYRMGDNENCKKHLSKLIEIMDLRQRSPQVYANAHKIWDYIREDDKEEEKKKSKAPVKKSGRSSSAKKEHRLSYYF